MALLDDLQRLSELHSSGALTDAEFSAAKQRLLANPETGNRASHGVTSSPNVAEKLLLEAELARVDREFERVRQSLMVRGGGKYNSYPVEPSTGSTVAGIISIIIVIAFFGFFSSMPHGGMGGLVIVPILVIIVIIWGIVSNESKLTALNEARQQHQAIRSRIMARLAQIDHR